MFSKDLAHLGGLQRKLSSRNEEECLNLEFGDIDLLEGRDDECCSFARSILRAGENVTLGESNRDSFFLDRRRLFEAGFKYAHQEFTS